MLGYIESLVSQPPAPPSTVEPAIPEPLSNLVVRLLARNPADRPASAAALAAELAALQLTGDTVSPTRSVSEGPPQARSASDGAGQRLDAAPAAYRPGNHRLWVGVAAGGALLLGLAVIAPYLPRGERSAITTAPATTPPLPPAKVQVLQIDVKHFTADDEACGLLGAESFVTHEKDYVKLTTQLSRPAPAYLIAFNPDGAEELLFPDEDALPQGEGAPRYPWRTEDRGKSFSLEDGEGLQVFVVVVLRRPLAYREWKAQRSKSPWKKELTPPNVVWWDNGVDIERQTADDRRKDKNDKGAAPVAALTDWLKKAPEVETVAALGFAVVGKNRR
jgi:hypothetical protein